MVWLILCCCVLWISGGIEISCIGAEFSFVIVCGESAVNQYVL